MSKLEDLKTAVAGGDNAEIIAAADALNITDGAMLSNDLVAAIVAAKGGVLKVQEPEEIKSNMHMVRMVDTDADGKVDSIDTDMDGRADKDDFDPLDPTVQDDPNAGA